MVCCVIYYQLETHTTDVLYTYEYVEEQYRQRIKLYDMACKRMLHLLSNQLGNDGEPALTSRVHGTKQRHRQHQNSSSAQTIPSNPRAVCTETSNKQSNSSASCLSDEALYAHLNHLSTHLPLALPDTVAYLPRISKLSCVDPAKFYPLSSTPLSIASRIGMVPTIMKHATNMTVQQCSRNRIKTLANSIPKAFNFKAAKKSGQVQAPLLIATAKPGTHMNNINAYTFKAFVKNKLANHQYRIQQQNSLRDALYATDPILRKKMKQTGIEVIIIEFGAPTCCQLMYAFQPCF